MDGELMTALRAELRSREAREKAAAFKTWIADLEQSAAASPPGLKAGFKADTELQPMRWMDAGLDLLESQKVAAWVELMDGNKGAPLQSFLPYPAFQMGTEIFLKGMWLCQFAECRSLPQRGFLSPDVRERHGKALKNLGHDLLKIIDALRAIPQYQQDATTTAFLTRVVGIIHEYYFPLYAADKAPWAASRYPKRFYDDAGKIGAADAFKSYPQQWLVVRLFEPMKAHIDRMWRITPGLIRKP